MREIDALKITQTVKRLCIEANCHLSSDIKERIESFYDEETWAQAKEILERIIENYNISDADNQPVCQ
ncbi:MAG: fumarate hydratase, partial [Clostridia bacterium]|nr:fumarate hydratase [Clostridia bacterium]